MVTIRLPRMRGDRPFFAQGRADERGATPHARGSTLEVEYRERWV